MPGAPNDAARVAVVDLGSNSTRLLVADVRDARVEKLCRRTQVTRLGEGVDASNRLTDEAMERVFDTLAGYRRVIDELEAELTVGVATSAVRDAHNRDDFLGGLSERFGLEARSISGEEEARLTFLGATSGRPGGEPTLVLDIGGGSTEFVVGDPGGEPDFHASARAGVVRQTERHLESDPPSPRELQSLQSEVRGIIEEAIPAQVRRSVTQGIAVAGTATSLAAIDRQVEPYDPAKVHGHVLGLPECERMLAMLAALPLAERREVSGLHPDRAPMIVAGAAIFEEAAHAFGLEEMETSEADILHGAALRAAREKL